MLNKNVFLKRTVVGVIVALYMLAMVVGNLVFTDYPNNSHAIFGIITGRNITALLIAIVTTFAVIEMRRALGTKRIPQCFNWPIYVYAVCCAPVYCLFGGLGTVIFLLLILVASWIIASKHKCTKNVLYVAFVLLYPGLTMLSLLYLNRCACTKSVVNAELLAYTEEDLLFSLGTLQTSTAKLLPYNAIGLAFVLAISSFTDIFAYLFGSVFGKHKLCPNISPNKTVEGAIFGLLGGLVGSAVVFFAFEFGYLYNVPSMQIVGAHFGLHFTGISKLEVYMCYAFLGFFGAIMTQIGDLFASAVKRKCGIKDYGKILGPHGGIMDRFDGIMMNSLFVALAYYLII